MVDIIKTFNSITSFDQYLQNNPINNVFENYRKKRGLASVIGTKSFTGTESYDQARDFMLHGWSSMSKEVVIKFNVGKIGEVNKLRDTLSVEGYHPVVPLYLAGVPQNMVSRKQVIMKQKVFTIDKLIDYNCLVTTEEILENSVKALQIINSLESRGYRCNLYVSSAAREINGNIVCRVKIKSSNERINLSKMSFPLINPSMLRRMVFRFIETHPDTPKSFTSGYGMPMNANSVRDFYKRHKIDTYVIGQYIKCDVKDIKSLDDLLKI